MECEDICYDLCAYLDGELEPEKIAAAKEHLSSCPRCRNEFSACQCMKALLRERLGKTVAPDNLWNTVMAELERAEEYRESGIQALDLIPWGTHIAQLCKDKGEETELLALYILAGLEQGELCVWITPEMSQAMEALANRVPDPQMYIDTGQLQFFSHDEWYLSGGHFDAQYVLDEGMKKYSEALHRGHEGLRITGNLFWLDQSNWNSFMEYEDRMNSVVHDYKLLVICVYEKNECIMDNIGDVVNTHEYVISKASDAWRLRRLMEV